MTCGLVVERLRLMTSNPSSTAQRRPAARIAPLPRLALPRTRTAEIRDPGASDRTIPAQAVPCPNTSPSSSSTTSMSSADVPVTVTARSTPPTMGWSASTPLSSRQTRTPSPVEPPIAQSRVTSKGHLEASEMAPTSWERRVYEGSESPGTR